jgi:glutathione S-transferase
MQVPYLVDPNTARELYESDDIVAYLGAQYGPRTARGAAATA